MTHCPPEDTLRDYLEESLPPEASGPVTGHIDGCPRCQARLDGLTRDGAHLVSRLRPAADGPPRPSAPTGPDHPTYVFEGGMPSPAAPLGAAVLPTIPGYVVQAELGRGGMGVVYQAVHRRLNRPTAVKMVLAGGVADPRVTQRFLFEAEVLGRVRHPQVVQVYEVSMFVTPTGVSVPFLAMEYLTGGTLGDWSDGRPQPPRAAAELVEGVARAVHAAHLQGVIHRDLKPANILRGADGAFKVTDFGLAKLAADSGGGLTGTGTVVGTPAYMAPEQASGEKGIGPAADVYSLGAILFELLAGRPPFEGGEPMSVLLKVIRDRPPDVRAVRRDVPRDLAAVVAKCLTKEPHRRYGSAAELADDLTRFRDGRPTRARTHGTAERLWYWAKRNPAVAAMLAALVAVLAASFVSVLVLWQRAEENAGAMAQARDAARRQSEEAEVQRDEAGRQRRAADRHAAYLAFDQAVHWCENGQLDDGLRGFVRALDLAERTGDAALARVARVNVAAWDRELFPAGRGFRHSDTAPLAASGFSPDGRWVFTAGTDQRVLLWDADSGERVAELTGAATGHVSTLLADFPIGKRLVDPPTVRAVAVSRDRTRVAACLSSGGLAVWSAAGGKPLRAFSAAGGTFRTGDLWAVEFDADGRLWVGGDGGLLARFDVETGKAVDALAVPLLDNAPTSVQSLRLSADGRTLFAGDRAGRLLEWDLPTRRRSQTHVGGWVGDIGLTPAGDAVAVASTAGAGVVRLRGEGRWVLPTNGAYASTVQFVADGRLLVLGDEDGKARVWDTATRGPVGGPLRMGAFAKRISVRPGRAEILVPKDKGVRLQPLPPPPAVPFESDGRGVRVRVLAFAPDGRRLLVGSGGLSVHDAETGRSAAAVLTDEEALGGRFLAGGTRVLYGVRTGWGVFDLAGGRAVGGGGGHYVGLFPSQPDADPPSAFVTRQFLRLRPDGESAAPTAAPKGVDLGVTPPTAACVAPGGREVRFATYDAVHFHDLDTGAVLRPPIRAPDEIRAMAQVPDGTSVVLGLRDNTVQVWDVAAGAARQELPSRHEMAVTSLAVSPSGLCVLSGSRDQTARFWDLGTGLVLGPRLRHADAVTVVAYSPLGDRVATGTSMGRTALWPVPPPPVTDSLDVLRDRYAGLVGNARPEVAVNK